MHRKRILLPGSVTNELVCCLDKDSIRDLGAAMVFVLDYVQAR